MKLDTKEDYLRHALETWTTTPEATIDFLVVGIQDEVERERERLYYTELFNKKFKATYNPQVKTESLSIKGILDKWLLES